MSLSHSPFLYLLFLSYQLTVSTSTQMFRRTRSAVRFDHNATQSIIILSESTTQRALGDAISDSHTPGLLLMPKAPQPCPISFCPTIFNPKLSVSPVPLAQYESVRELSQIYLTKCLRACPAHIRTSLVLRSYDYDSVRSFLSGM
ncbi:hypothetical protein PENSPDRAFT_59590 [Peniophora sp. CONT]|nr:hypothetical protein PENSPDRAFT_59590 [Peniophora sp. CONT]